MLSASGRYGPSRLELLWMIFALVCLAIPEASGFNLEPESVQIFADPTMNETYWGRDSYFGYSVALQRNHNDNSTWLVVGAPRANSSMYNPTEITEPGAIFKCDLLNDQTPCQELRIDQEGNKRKNYASYTDFKNGGWLGASLDSQPTRGRDQQATAVCAPRWSNQIFTEFLMNGVCYWLNASLPDAPAHKMIPLVDHKKQIVNFYGQNAPDFAFGQAGISIHFPDDPKEMIIGAPGIWLWQGSVIRLKDDESLIPSQFSSPRQRPSRSESSKFSVPLVPNPYYTGAIQYNDLNGYAVTSGRFFNNRQLLYVSGSPRGSSMHGQVIIFDFPDRESSELIIFDKMSGSQLGENFGASLVSADVNGDGFSDLVVGSPTFSEPNTPDMGKMQVFLGGKNRFKRETSSHEGSRTSMARFSTTLASPGDINHDGFEDVAVGAPWENDGKGSVYIYLGSKLGLQKDFAQRLSPEDIPTSVNLKGFGISISRGIDIDGNNYPDLAIGSFVSGHALVLRSRPVASLWGYIIVDPPALVVEDTKFEVETCVKYKGDIVPKLVDVHGSISLDNGHPSPRATFTNNGLRFQNVSIEASKDHLNCRKFDVHFKTSQIEARRPVLVRFDYQIKDIPGKRLALPKTDPSALQSKTFPINILTDCDNNGNTICEFDMHIEAAFVNYQENQKLIIGDSKNPVMRITVNNDEESVFLANITIKVPKPFALFKPTSHSCNFAIEDNPSELVCQLTNPMTKDVEDVMEVTIDARHVTDAASNELRVGMQVTGDGVELNPDDNIETQKLQLSANAAMQLRGYSRGEEILYQRLDEDTINTTIAKTSFTHYYTLVKSGPTPLEKVEFAVDIPVNFTGDVNFITLYEPQTNFMNQPFMCSVVGATLAVDRMENGKSGGEAPDIMTNEAMLPPTTRYDENSLPLLPGTKKDEVHSANLSMDEIRTFTCPSTQVSCAKLRCQINSWPGGQSSAEFSIKMDVNFIALADHISARAGAVVSSTATASIVSLGQDLIFNGKQNTTLTVDTDLLPLGLPKQGVPWWMILVAVLGGLLVLILLVLALYKIGFFRREQQEMLEAKRALLAAETNNEAMATE